MKLGEVVAIAKSLGPVFHAAHGISARPARAGRPKPPPTRPPSPNCGTASPRRTSGCCVASRHGCWTSTARRGSPPWRIWRTCTAGCLAGPASVTGSGGQHISSSRPIGSATACAGSALARHARQGRFRGVAAQRAPERAALPLARGPRALVDAAARSARRGCSICWTRHGAKVPRSAYRPPQAVRRVTAAAPSSVSRPGTAAARRFPEGRGGPNARLPGPRRLRDCLRRGQPIERRQHALKVDERRAHGGIAVRAHSAAAEQLAALGRASGVRPATNSSIVLSPNCRARHQSRSASPAQPAEERRGSGLFEVRSSRGVAEAVQNLG